MADYTSTDICKEFGVKPDWLSKVIRELGLSRQGRGSKRKFKESEYRWVRNVMVMRMCGVPWKQIQDLKRKESMVKSGLEEFFELGKYSHNEKVYEIVFVLNESIKTTRHTGNKSVGFSKLQSLGELEKQLVDIQLQIEKGKKQVDNFLSTDFYKLPRSK